MLGTQFKESFHLNWKERQKTLKSTHQKLTDNILLSSLSLQKLTMNA